MDKRQSRRSTALKSSTCNFYHTFGMLTTTCSCQQYSLVIMEFTLYFTYKMIWGRLWNPPKTAKRQFWVIQSVILMQNKQVWSKFWESTGGYWRKMPFCPWCTAATLSPPQLWVITRCCVDPDQQTSYSQLILEHARMISLKWAKKL